MEVKDLVSPRRLLHLQRTRGLALGNSVNLQGEKNILQTSFAPSHTLAQSLDDLLIPALKAYILLGLRNAFSPGPDEVTVSKHAAMAELRQQLCPAQQSGSVSRAPSLATGSFHVPGELKKSRPVKE